MKIYFSLRLDQSSEWWVEKREGVRDETSTLRGRIIPNDNREVKI